MHGKMSLEGFFCRADGAWRQDFRSQTSIEFLNNNDIGKKLTTATI